MRLLTWNINGLRAVLKRKYGSLKALLDDLGADIICFQETKLTKADLDRELALVDGWFVAELLDKWHRLSHANAHATHKSNPNTVVLDRADSRKR